MGNTEESMTGTSWDEALNDEKSDSSATVSLPDESEEEETEKRGSVLSWPQPSAVEDQDVKKKSIAVLKPNFGAEKVIVVSRTADGLFFTKPLVNNSPKRKFNSSDEDTNKKIKLSIPLPKPTEQEDKFLELLSLLRTFRPLLKKKLIEKDEMWEKIAEQLNIGSEKGAKKKWQDMLLQYHKCQQRDEAGSIPKQPAFFKEIHSLVGEGEECGDSDFNSGREVNSAPLELSEESSDEEFSNSSSREDEELPADKGNSGNFRIPVFWSYERSLELINLVKKYYLLLTDKRIKRKTVFERILGELENPGNLTVEKVEKKWRNLMNQYKKYIIVLNQNGPSRMKKPPFFKEMHAFVGKHEFTDEKVKLKGVYGIADSPDEAKLKSKGVYSIADSPADEVKLKRVNGAADFPEEKGRLKRVHCRVDTSNDRLASISGNSSRPSAKHVEEEGVEDVRQPDPTSTRRESYKVPSMEQSLKDLVDLENRKFNFLVGESEKKHKFKLDFLAAINKRTESLNRLERKVEMLLRKSS